MEWEKINAYNLKTFPSYRFLYGNLEVMENSLAQSNNDAELNFHKALIKFTVNTWDKPETAVQNATDLSQALDALLVQNSELSDEFIGYVAIIINTVLCADYKGLYGLQQRSLPLPKRYNREEMKDALPILYSILQRIGFERIHQRINGTFFCNDPKYLYICPRRPPKKDYKYTHGEFVLPNNSTPKHFSLQNIQHVVHDVHDLMSILNLTTNAQQNILAEFTGGPHHVYHGPDIIWFGPASFDSNTSCYGSYRFSIPTEHLLKYKAYILGTRQYDEEYCHTIMFTDAMVESVKLMEELQSVELDQIKIIQRTSDGIWQWQCYRWNDNEYDQLDFALAFRSLKFNPTIDNIRLDFVDHHDCMRNKYNRAERQCIDKSRTNAMKEFLSKLTEYQIDLSSLEPYFQTDVYEELQKLKEENSLSFKCNH